ncbi:MAG: 4-alpha-glucanotransferase [Acidobacteriota bacterium]|nr:4-alpha-glucanotransferase [Acidobacteriota bacterium]
MAFSLASRLGNIVAPLLAQGRTPASPPRPPRVKVRAMDTRSAGILLHPTSLPGPYGIGDLGPSAVTFLDWAERAGQRLWQVLPLGPTHGGGSPYGCLSAFAGNPWLISPELLRRQGFLSQEYLASATAPQPAGGDPHQVDFPAAAATKERLLHRAWEVYQHRATSGQRQRLEEFREHPDQRSWLDDWALFASLRAAHGNRGWWQWDAELARREPGALRRARQELRHEIERHYFIQHQFFLQWGLLREHALSRGIRLFGDLPIYVAWDSADVWAHRRLFELDDEGEPLAVAGVPPDYFSPTGQLWGNPLYRWEKMAEEGFSWWIERVRANLRLTDLVRLDHFRAFAGYWRVPAGEPTAENGTWEDGPGKPFFEALREELGDLPLVAEDLGVITPDVDELRTTFRLPGIRVLQFGLDDPDSIHAPHNLAPHTVVYTGTHDNDTSRGWYASCSPRQRQRIRQYTGGRFHSIHWDLIRQALTSVARIAVVPMQDVLGLGSEARMNTPGQPDGNWGWRLTEDQLLPEQAARLRALTGLSGRVREGRGELG